MCLITNYEMTCVIIYLSEKKYSGDSRCLDALHTMEANFSHIWRQNNVLVNHKFDIKVEFMTKKKLC